LPYVLKKELEMVAMFEHVVTLCVDNGELDLSLDEIKMIAHNIFVQGQMWAFRRWTLQKMYSLEEYIHHQTILLFQGIQGTRAEELDSGRF
jgi:TetR/AcrR family transcriptional regulator, cholesterol catabolism regulator